MKWMLRRIGQQLVTALSTKGLAMLVNHGIAEEKLKAVYADLENFCALPEGCQRQYLHNPDNGHGYARPGMDQHDDTKKELRHSFNITQLSAGALPGADEVPEFEQHAVPLAHDLTNLSRVLLQALAFALEKNNNRNFKMFNKGISPKDSLSFPRLVTVRAVRAYDAAGPIREYCETSMNIYKEVHQIRALWTGLVTLFLRLEQASESARENFQRHDSQRDRRRVVLRSVVSCVRLSVNKDRMPHRTLAMTPISVVTTRYRPPDTSLLMNCDIPGLPPATLIACHSGMLRSEGRNASSMRLLYYPPVPPEDEDPASRDKPYTRCGAHADYGTFTLLAQDSEGGLEVKLNGSDKWEALGHLPGAILVQSGELLATWTTNQLPALMHRVVVPSGAYARARGRHCVAFFCHPDKDCVMPTLPPRIAPPPPPAYAPHAHVHLTLHHRLLNVAHHLHKRFRETYA
ncbi:2-oxoglutarate-dependent dioxygenase htyE [Eumeta japonica]|uniref:2-oxoglutarate-dependent dioxygenase htyE n=1 Tax=Eumeta variegata TaxID=151549 RepID=A0A4C1VTV4_EUMVA|nr:2-oxoglutarate-dependent dioxygenase htyE [Eumeta japonica]